MSVRCKHILISIIFSLAACTGVAQAAPSACAGQYFQDQRPDLINKKLGSHARELCSDAYAVWYSGVARAPLWAAEFLTKGRIEAGYKVPRSNSFREDVRLPSDWRARLSDFKGSGMDRGHLVPSADSPTLAADAQSFLLSNIVAQDPQLNRNLWSAIESAVRAKAKHQSLYVITGALFIGSKIDRLNGRVMIPTHLYKLLYDPASNQAGAYVVENKPNKRHREVGLLEINRLAGVDLLPAVKHVGRMKLPKPRY